MTDLRYPKGVKPPRASASEGTAAPALSDAELRETIDTMGLLVASVSNRVDDQGRILEKLTHTAAETRAAAFAAQRATDWERNGELAAKAVTYAMNAALERLAQADRHIERSRQLADQTDQLLRSATAREAQHRSDKAQIWKRRTPWLLAGALVLGMGLMLVGAHFLSRLDLACNFLGGRVGVFDSDGYRGCAFRQW